MIDFPNFLSIFANSSVSGKFSHFQRTYNRPFNPLLLVLVNSINFFLSFDVLFEISADQVVVISLSKRIEQIVELIRVS